MNTRIFTLLLLLAFLSLPLDTYGQWGPTGQPPQKPQMGTSYPSYEDGIKMANYMKGDGDFESWFFDGFAQLDSQIETRANQAGRLGGYIGSIGALIFLSIVGFRMQMGTAEWDIEPMLKPTIILLILTNWWAFTQMIQAPFQLLAEPPKAIFKEFQKQGKSLRDLRYTKQMQITEAISRQKAELQAKREGFWTKVSKGDVGEAFGDQWDDMMSSIEEAAAKFDYSLQKTIGSLLESLSLTILRVCVYFIFFIQKIWSYVLITLGPIAVGISLIPGFESSFYNWVSKFININLYTFVAYTIIDLGQQIIIMGYLQEINRLSAIVDAKGVVNQGLLMAYSAHDGKISQAVFSCVSFLVTAAGVLMTPTIADSIVSAGGAGIMTKAKQAAAKVGSAGKASGKSGIGAGKAVAGGISKLGGAVSRAAHSNIAASTMKAVENAIGGMGNTLK